MEQFNCQPFLCRHSPLSEVWQRFCVACPYRKEVAIGVIALVVLGLSLAFSLHATRPEMLKGVSKIGHTFKHHAMAFEIAGGTIFGCPLLTAIIYKIHGCHKTAKEKKDDAFKRNLYEGSGDEPDVENLSESYFPIHS